MRLHRIVLHNYRGVRHADVSPALNGMTIVEGPNEVGKSSLAEALDLLFEELDSSAKARVKAVKPVDRDVGPEVEVELTTGPYHAVYAKRWKPGAGTRLRLLTPKPENLTGRPAHDRMKEILEETLDSALWGALRHQQGVTITQAGLGDCHTLVQALDAAAASGAVGGEDEADLWERVQDEHHRYFTATGRPSGERVKLSQRVAELRERVQELEHQLAALDATAEGHRKLTEDLKDNTHEQTRQEELLGTQQAAWNALEHVRSEVEHCRLLAETAAGSGREALTRVQERSQLIEAVGAAATELEALTEQAGRDAPGLQSAHTVQERALAARDSAARARAVAEQARRQAEDDHAHFHEMLDAELLAERLGRVSANEAKLGQTHQFLEGCPIDEQRLREIEHASEAALEARALATAQGATVSVHALAPLQLSVGEQHHQLAPGDQHQAIALGELQLGIGQLARITVSGATAGRELQERAAATRDQLDRLLAAAGISGDDPLGQARALERRRGEALAEGRRATDALKEDLRDFTPASMAEKIERARVSIASYRAARSAATALPADLEQAKAVSQSALLAAAEAARIEAARQAELQAADHELGQATQDAAKRDVRIEIARGRLTTSEQALAGAREQVTDEELHRARSECEVATAQALEEHRRCARELAGQDPDSAEAILKNTTHVLERLRREHQDLAVELARMARELEVRGEAGLHDQLLAARTELLAEEREHTLIERRAAAAQLLHAGLGRHRDCAKRAYVEPYKTQLDALAKIVFGPNVSIGVDHDDLEIESRTLDGVTLPYGALSAGAREQLCVLARLACAALVSPASPDGQPGGVPVIFDDALGYSDAARLERVGAAFNVVGERAQVIVLTCVPERYRNVGSAKVVRLQERD